MKRLEGTEKLKGGRRRPRPALGLLPSDSIFPASFISSLQTPARLVFILESFVFERVVGFFVCLFLVLVVFIF